MMPAVAGFVVFSDGLCYLCYYLSFVAQNKHEICFHDFATRRSSLIAKIDGFLHYGLSVSPDQKIFVFSRMSTGGDLMMLENFR
jgi:hypothetical protein